MARADVIQGTFGLSSRAGTMQPRVLRNARAIALPPGAAAFRSSVGHPLPSAVRQLAEAAFGTNFADVRVHIGAHAAHLGALVFTNGSNIHFAPGQYDPHSARGRQLLARELAHVVQQRAGRARNPFGSGIAVVHDAALEAEADRFARRAATVQMMMMSKSGGVQRAGTTYHHSVITKKDYIVTQTIEGSSKNEKRYYRLYAVDTRNELAEVRYSFMDNDMACVEHIDALNMPKGTRAGYLLLNLAAKDIIANKRTAVRLGTPVARDVVERNLVYAQETQVGVEGRLAELAAVAVYTALGFDVSTVMTANKSVVEAGSFHELSANKLTGYWLQNTAPSTKKNCFLTTACVQARGLPDGCEELTVLRRFRDGYVRSIDGGPALIAEYYDIAPGLVAAIEARSDRAAIFESIYGVVRGCVDAIGEGDAEEALRRYHAMVAGLERRVS